MRTRPTHVTLAVILQVRENRLCALLWERAREPFATRWALPGGYLGERETLEASIRRQLAQKVDVRELAHLEQLETRSDPDAASRRVAARHGLPRARPHGRRSGRPGGHGLASRRRASAHGVRPRGDHAVGPRAAAGEALLHERRLRARARRRSRSPSCATCTQPRSATRSRQRTSSACCCGAACSSRRASGALRAASAAGRRPCSASARRELEVTDPFAVLRPPAQP